MGDRIGVCEPGETTFNLLISPEVNSPDWTSSRSCKFEAAPDCDKKVETGDPKVAEIGMNEAAGETPRGADVKSVEGKDE